MTKKHFKNQNYDLIAYHGCIEIVFINPRSTLRIWDEILKTFGLFWNNDFSADGCHFIFDAGNACITIYKLNAPAKKMIELFGRYAKRLPVKIQNE